MYLFSIRYEMSNKYDCTRELESLTSIVSEYYDNFPNTKSSASPQLGLDGEKTTQKGWIQQYLLIKAEKKRVPYVSTYNVVALGMEHGITHRKKNIVKLHAKTQSVISDIITNIREYTSQNGKMYQKQLAENLGFTDYFSDLKLEPGQRQEQNYVISSLIDSAVQQNVLSVTRENNKKYITPGKRSKWRYIPYNSDNSNYKCMFNVRSKGEAKVAKVLTSYNIRWYNEYTFVGCKDIKPLRFDFYLPSYNLLIEFDGIQHTEPVDRFGGYEGFKLIKKHDKIKNRYAKENEIELWRFNDKNIDTISKRLETLEL